MKWEHGVKVTESAWEVEAEVLEPVPFDMAAPEDSTYPYPQFRGTGRFDVASLDTVVIENAYLSLTVCPSLGARIVEVVDKQADFVVFGKPEKLTGSSLAHLGVAFMVGKGIWRPAAPALYSVHESGSDDGSAGVIMGGVDVAAVDWHVGISMDAAHGSALIECRVHNRRSWPAWAPAGFLLPTGVGVLDQRRTSALIALTTQGGLGLYGDFLGTFEHGRLPLGFQRDGVLLPRETREWKYRLAPIVPGSGLVFEGGFAASVQDEKLQIRSADPHEQLKVGVVLQDRGEELQVTTDIGPSQALSTTLPGKIEKVAILDRYNQSLLSHPLLEDAMIERPSSVAQAICEAANQAQSEETPGEEDSQEVVFFRALRDGHAPPAAPPFLEAVAHLEQARRMLTIENYSSAKDNIEKSIERNPSDQIAWWMLALAERHLDPETRGEAMVSAQTLAPHDPIIRAEAFLATPAGDAPGPSPLVKPLADDPQGLIEVLNLLLGMGQRADAVRLISEALKHRSVALVHYIYADLLLSSRMDIEAATQVQMGGKLPLTPPFPMNGVEASAIRNLHERFPSDKRLADWKALLDAFLR